MEIAESIHVMKALADSSRLMLIQALQEPHYVEELAHRCNLATSTVSFHLGKLEDAGLVRKRKEQYYAVYELNHEVFSKTLRELTTFRNAEENVQEERIQRYRRKVYKSFVKNGRVIRLPAQYKKRLIVVEEILRLFHAKPVYTEKEVDEIISGVCDDYCSIRRTFVEEKMMERNGDVYRLTKPVEMSAASPFGKQLSRAAKVKSKQELKREYKERKKPAGVFQVKNTANGKVLLGSSLNLEGPLNREKFTLSMGLHRNQALQKDWNTCGADKFVFEILEVVKVKDDPNFDLNDELTLIEQIWLEKLQPFGERGYNTDSHIRQA